MASASRAIELVGPFPIAKLASVLSARAVKVESLDEEAYEDAFNFLSIVNE